MPTIANRGALAAQGYGFAGAAKADAVYVEDVFSTYLYTGNDSTQTITNGIDLSTKGGMVWIKSRTNTDWNTVYDTARGARASIFPDHTNATYTPGGGYGLTSFLTSGFTLGYSNFDNTASQNYASWTFRKQAKFFTICTWTGDGVAGRQISHDLGCAPGMIILKATSAAYNWRVYHKSIGATQHLALNTTDAANTLTGSWNDTSPTSTVFTIGNSPGVNESGQTYVAYLFADSNSGGFGAAGTDSVVACGSYTGNASASGPTVTLGWEPQFVLVKNSSAANDWQIVDTMRGMSYATGLALAPNLAKTETWEGTNPFIVPTSTGFKVITSSNASFNTSSNTYIYLAIRRGPMKTPTDATKVFAPITSSAATGTAQTTGFPIDAQLARLTGFSDSLFTMVLDRLRGVSSTSTAKQGPTLATSSTGAEDTTSYTNRNWNNTGFDNPNYISGSAAIYLNFRRAPGFFDVVCYSGTGSNQTVNHGLGVAPELLIVKKRGSTAGYWNVKTTSLYGWLNTNNALQNSTTYLDNLTASSFLAKNAANSNFDMSEAGNTYVAYLFATCPGVSKVGSYTGNGSSQTINCGFASGARFVLIKRTDSTGDWYVWDTARGIVSANDPHLSLNTTAAEVTTDDTIDPDSSGFIVNQMSATNVNVSSATYIYLAIA